MSNFERFISRLSIPQLAGLRDSIAQDLQDNFVQDPNIPIKLKQIDKEIIRAKVAPKSNKLPGTPGPRVPKYWNARRAVVPKGPIPLAPALFIPELVNSTAIDIISKHAEPKFRGLLRGFGVADTRTEREKAISALEWQNAGSYLKYVLSDDYITGSWKPETLLYGNGRKGFSEESLRVAPDTYKYKKRFHERLSYDFD